MNLRKSLYYPISFLIFTGAFFVLSNASIGNLIYPFAFSFMFALCWSNQKPWIICPAFFVGSILYNHSFDGIICSTCTVLMLVVPYYIHVLLKKNMKVWELGIFASISQTPAVLFSLFSGGMFYYDIISTAVGVIFLYLSIFILENIFEKGLMKRLNALELISGGIVLAILSDGLTGLSIGPFSFLKFFASFVILFTAYVSRSSNAVVISGILGVGSLIGLNNPVFVGPLLIWAMSISPFKSYKRYFMPIAMILSDCLVGFYFNLYYNFSPWEIAPVVAGVMCFILVPEKIFDKIKIVLAPKSARVAVKDVVNRNRELLQNKLASLSDAFADMNRSLLMLSSSSISEKDMKDVLKREVKGKICENCPEKQRCFRTYMTEIGEVFNEIADISFEKGKISVLDVPNFLSVHCGRVPAIISETNTLCQQYQHYAELVGNVDTSKLLVAEQLGGISDILKNLSIEIEKPISFDSIREQKIVDELMFNDIICDDVVVFQKDIYSLEVGVIVKNEDRDNLVIPKIISNICGVDMCVEDYVRCVKPGWTTLKLKTAPKYDCVFGISTKSKGNLSKSGDTHSILKLGSEKVMFALCDGMGSGENANRTSEIAIGLVENFYKAGFESDLVVSSVNKLLTLQKQDSFSAVDICVLDLKNGVGNFIKLGSPNSFVLGKESFAVIEGGALPLGIIKDSGQTNKKMVLHTGDYVVLMTDGISDSFSSDNDLENFICSLHEGNPQELSDKILEQALKNNQGIPKDDMSVIVVKII